MGRRSKKAQRSRLNGAKSKAVLGLTVEHHTFFESAPALTLSAPRRIWVERGSSARKMHLLAHTSWQYVVAHFDSVPLEDKTGNFFEPTDDYGGLRALMTIIPKEEAGQQTGFKFMGTPDPTTSAARARSTRPSPTNPIVSCCRPSSIHSWRRPRWS